MESLCVALGIINNLQPTNGFLSEREENIYQTMRNGISGKHSSNNLKQFNFLVCSGYDNFIQKQATVLKVTIILQFKYNG